MNEQSTGGQLGGLSAGDIASLIGGHDAGAERSTANAPPTATTPVDALATIIKPARSRRELTM